MVTAAGWGEAVEFNVFHVPQFVDGKDGGFEGNLVTDAGGCHESPEFGLFLHVCCVIVGLVLFPSCRVLSIGIVWMFLVNSDLGIPECFSPVILRVPSGLEAFYCLLSGPIWTYHG